MNTWRNRLAVRLCNVILRTLATKRYRDMLKGSILYGLSAAARDKVAGRQTKGADQR